MSTASAARIFKCLSEGLRLRLVRLLRQEELNGHELRTILEVPQSTLSRHLTVLKDAGLLATRRQGSWTYYSLAKPAELNGQGEAIVELVQGLLAEDELADHDRTRLEQALEERRRAVREHFERRGHTWDDFNRRVADPAAKLEGLTRLIPEGLVLVDAGCGSGYLLPELARIGGRVIAVDNAPNQLEAARDEARQLGIEGIEFREGDLTALPVRDGGAAAVFAHLSLHHVSRPEAAIADMKRVLAPGGVLVVTDFLPHEETWLRDEHADLWLGFEPDDVAGWMRAAGLEIGRCERRDYVAPTEKERARLAAGLELFILSGRAPREPERT